MTLSRRCGVFFVLLTLTACGGGGEAEDENTFGRPLPSGNVHGSVQFWRADVLAVEREPNDTAGQAQRMPDIYPGESRAAYGQLDVGGGRDVVDSFRLRAPDRVSIQATLRFGGTNDFQLALYDPLSMQFLRAAPRASGAFLEFNARGVFDLVVIGHAGFGGYELFYEALARPSPITLSEPDDDALSATLLGEIRHGEQLTLDGFLEPPQDSRDTMLLSCPEHADVRLEMDIPFSDFELHVSDVTAGLDQSAPIVTLDGPSSTRVAVVSVAAGTLLHVACVSTTASGPWRMRVSSQALSSAKIAAGETHLRAGKPSIASLAAESRWLSRAATAYGTAEAMVVGEALVCFCEGAEQAGRACVEARGCTLDESNPHVCVARIPMRSDLTESAGRRWTLARCCGLAGPSCVRYAEPNHRLQLLRTPSDTLYPEQRWAHEMMNLPDAWDLTTGNQDTVVAIVDSGSITHFDLTSRFIDGYDFVSDVRAAVDGDGIDPDPEDPIAWVYWGHGAMVAGVLGASSDNERGITGVDWKARLMPIRIAGSGPFHYTATVVDVTNGIRYVSGLSNATGTFPPELADVINLSLGFLADSETLRLTCEAARRQGVLLVAAAGNFYDTRAVYPAAYPSVLSVSALDSRRQRAEYSSYGSTVALCAPAGDPRVDDDGDGFADLTITTGMDRNSQQVYHRSAGTSFAAPRVAGVASLVKGVNPDLSPSQIEAILIATAIDLGPPGRDDEFGHGLVDAHAAVRAAFATLPPQEQIPPAPPRLHAWPHVLQLLAKFPARDLWIRNSGGSELAALEVTRITTSTLDGQPWLTASLHGVGDVTRNVDRALVEVDRTGLGTGVYFGTVHLESNGGDLDVPVVMQSNTSLPPPPNVDITVQALNADTGEVVQERTINLASSREFAFRSLPIGTYIFRASSDIDGDGVLCEEGEICGAFPLHGDPQPISVFERITRTDIHFDITRQTSESDE